MAGVVRPRVWAGATAIAIAFAMHSWQVGCLFPSLRAVTDPRPLVAVDHALHLYHGYLGARAIRQRGVVCGYDPAFMAGYRRTPVFDPSANLAELSQLWFRRINPAAYKVAVCVVTLLQPALVAAAAWALTRSVAAAAATVWLTVLYFWVGYPNGLLRSGLVAFLWSAALSVLLVACLSVHVGEWTRRRWLGFLLLGAIGLQSHPTFPIQCLPACLVWAVARARRPIAWWLGTASCVLGAAVLAAPWIVPLVAHLGQRSASAPFLQARGAGFLVDYWAGDWSYRADAHLPSIVGLWLVAGCVAAWPVLRPLRLLIWHAVWLAFLTFAGSYIAPLRTLEPLRFQVPMCLTLIALTTAVWISAGANWSALPRGQRGIGLVATAAATVLGGWLAVRATVPAARVRFAMHRPLPLGYTPEMRMLVGLLRRVTSNEHRILFEDQLRLWEATDPESTHWTPLLPVLTGRIYIGGLYELAPLPHNYASFGDFHLAGRRIDQWQAEELREFLRQYNIGWVVTWSRRGTAEEPPRATEVFESLPWCRVIARVPRYSSKPAESWYTVFEVSQPGGWAIQGGAGLERASFDEIVFKAVRPPESGDLVVLSLHYDPALVPSAPVRLEPVTVGDDPVPFVGVRTRTPLERLVLRFRWPIRQ